MQLYPLQSSRFKNDYSLHKPKINFRSFLFCILIVDFFEFPNRSQTMNTPRTSGTKLSLSIRIRITIIRDSFPGLELNIYNHTKKEHFNERRSWYWATNISPLLKWITFPDFCPILSRKKLHSPSVYILPQ